MYYPPPPYWQPPPPPHSAAHGILIGVGVGIVGFGVIIGVLTFALTQPSQLNEFACGLGSIAACNSLNTELALRWIGLIIAGAFAVGGIIVAIVGMAI